MEMTLFKQVRMLIPLMIKSLRKKDLIVEVDYLMKKNCGGFLN
jgi:hypothetical protein